MIDGEFDAVVIGGGPAGCAAAISLARDGHRVILLEAERGAPRKTCGEFLSVTAVRWLGEANVLPRLLQCGAIPIPEWSLATPRRELVRPFSSPGLALSRSLLDPLLRDACRDAGAVVVEGARVQSVERGAQGHEVRFMNGSAGSVLRAGIVVGAAGRGARIAGFAAPPRESRPRRARYIAMKAHARASSLLGRPSRVSLYALRGAYVGVVPSGSASFNVCFLARADVFPRGARGDSFLLSETRSHPLWERQWRSMDLAGARWTAVSTLDFEKRRPVQEGILHAGDAAAMVSPLWGEGMAMALESGTMAARCADRILRRMPEQSPCEERSALAEYRTLWRRRFAVRLAAGEVLQRVLLSPRAVEVGALLAGMVPAFADWIVRSGASPTNGKLAPILAATGDQR